MKIGEFVTLLHTTKDTVRHYEELKLLTPLRLHRNKEYGEKEILNFEAVKELQEYGLALAEIQMIFRLKEAFECGDKELIARVVHHLTEHLDKLKQEEEELRTRRLRLEAELGVLKEWM